MPKMTFEIEGGEYEFEGENEGSIMDAVRSFIGSFGKTEDSSKQRTSEGKINTGDVQIDEVFEDVFGKLITQESQGKHFDDEGGLTTSPVGAQGITQVMPATGKDPGYGVEPLKNNTKEEFIRFGRDYLKAMLGKYGGDYEKALAAYNAGPGNVDKAIKKGGDNWKKYLPKPSETLPYIENILGEESA